MTCPHSQHANPVDARFCIGCAHRFMGELALKTNPAQIGAPLAAPYFEHSKKLF